MKKKVISILMIVASVVLCVVSFLLLPSTVITQLSVGNSNPTTMPKVLAVMLPTLLGIGGAIASLFGKKESYKPLIISCAGILVFIIMLVVNL